MSQAKNKKTFSPYLLVLASFLVIILIGSFLLCIPQAQVDGQWGNYVDSLFIATSSTCVTGLCSYENGIGNTLTLFGQIIVLIMIQIGGLGFITIMTFFITLFKKRIQLKNRLILAQAIGTNTLADVVKFVRKIIIISAVAEVLGFLLILPAVYTIQTYTTSQKVWSSFFIAVSAFNNAGFDLFGATSLIRDQSEILTAMPSWAYYYMLSVIMILITAGGISFLVLTDILSFKKRPSQWRAFTKIVLSTSTILLLLGTLLFVISESFKGEESMDFFNALFQSVTCRTAGFANYDQTELTTFGKITSCILMYIGGSPLSTAGGIKTTTTFMIILAIVCYLSGRKVTAFNRQYSQNMIVKAMSVVFLSLILIIMSYGTISLLEKDSQNIFATSENLAFEVFSAFGTVGLSASVTPFLTIGSKIILCILMFCGRLGPMTLFQVFSNNMNKKTDTHFEYVEEDFLIG